MNFFKRILNYRRKIKFIKTILKECRDLLPDNFESQTTPATYEYFREFLEEEEFECAMDQLESIADDLEYEKKEILPNVFWIKMHELASYMELAENAEYYHSKFL